MICPECNKEFQEHNEPSPDAFILDDVEYCSLQCKIKNMDLERIKKIETRISLIESELSIQVKT